MKKVIAAVVVLLILLLAGLGGLVYWLLQAEPQPIEDTAAIPVVGQSQEESPKTPVKEPKVKVNKPYKTEADMAEALAKATEKNADTTGWIYIPGTDINNSVLQSNNNTYYLRLTEKKEASAYGCYFADYTCNFGPRELLSPNTIIYGHSDLKDDKDGLRFSQLFRFTEEDFAKQTPGFTFATQEESMKWQIFSVFYTESDMEYYHGDMSPEQLQSIVAEAKQKSLYQYDVAVEPTDKIITLSTCTVKYGTRTDQRFVVMAKLVPSGAELPKSATFTVNPTPLQPEFVDAK